MSKLVLFAVVIVLQTCLTMADTDDSPGVLEKAKEAYRGLKARLVDVSSTVAEFAQMYYEDQVMPVTKPYIQWAKESASSFWDRFKGSDNGSN